MRNGLLAFASAFAGWVALGCADRTTPPAVSYSIDSSGSFPVVRSTAALEQGWRLQPVLSVGSAEEGPHGFGAIWSVLAAPNGQLIVLDGRLLTIKTFDSTGVLIRTIGRSGAGPGEYSSPYSIAWISDTSFALMDPNNGRTGYFSVAGAWLGQGKAERATGSYSFVRFYRAPPAAAWVMGYISGPQGGQRMFVRVDPAGADTIPFSPHPTQQWGIACQQSGNLHFFSSPYSPTLLQQPTKDGKRYVVWTDRYRILLLSRSDDTVRVLEREVSNVPVTDAEWDSADEIAQWKKFRADNPNAACSQGGLERPANHPSVLAMWLDDRDRLWVEARTAVGDVIDVFDPGGWLIASIPAPLRLRAVDPSVRGSWLAIAADSSDVPIAKLFRLER